MRKNTVSAYIDLHSKSQRI